jgi:hypothetical protein
LNSILKSTASELKRGEIKKTDFNEFKTEFKEINLNTDWTLNTTHKINETNETGTIIEATFSKKFIKNWIFDQIAFENSLKDGNQTTTN